MAGKYYAVKEGLSRGIFLTWEECKASVSGYSGAVYKSFKTRQEAKPFLESDRLMFAKQRIVLKYM